MLLKNKKSIFFDIYFEKSKHRKIFDKAIENIVLLKLPESEIIQAIDEIIDFYKLNVFFRGNVKRNVRNILTDLDMNMFLKKGNTINLFGN